MKLSSQTAARLGLLGDLLLLGLIALGIGFRFSWVNWNQDANLHPDEYGLTNTLTQLAIPESLAEYFNTRLAPLSPYHKYDLAGNFLAAGPDNRMRWGQWPQIIIRTVAHFLNQTGYNELRLVGRRLSASADVLTLGLLYLLSKRLYTHQAGLLATALYALAVLPIQQAHFMTVDHFGVFFTILALYAGVRIAQAAPRRQPDGRPDSPDIKTDPRHYLEDRTEPWPWYALFGMAFGMALATRINLLPLGGLLVVAAFISIADIRLRSQQDLKRIGGRVGLQLILASVVTLLTFRFAQPMSFRAPHGETTFFTFTPNPDWVDSMQVASRESQLLCCGPPAEQWTDRPKIIFPWVNMVVWGLGLPLGLTAWLAFFWATWCVARSGASWRAHLIPLVWVGGYFLFMGTRWVMSMRYFLPLYPFLSLLAAWGLLEIWRWGGGRQSKGTRLGGLLPSKTQPRSRSYKTLGALLITIGVVGGTLGWANSFVTAVYRTENTRLQASRWIYQNIPGPFHLKIATPQGELAIPLAAPESLEISADSPFVGSFTAPASGDLVGLTLPHAGVQMSAGQPEQLHSAISPQPEGPNALAEAWLTVQPLAGHLAQAVQAAFPAGRVEAGKTYFLVATTPSETPISIARTLSTTVVKVRKTPV